MSAFMLSENHIRQMVALALHGPADNGQRYPGEQTWYPPRWFADTPDGRLTHYANQYEPAAMMSMLAMENLASIHYRYPDTIADPDMTPGPVERWYERPFVYTEPRRMATALEGLSLLSCYEYQSCEHPEWEQSEAHSFVRAVESSLISTMTRHNDVWEWDHD